MLPEGRGNPPPVSPAAAGRPAGARPRRVRAAGRARERSGADHLRGPEARRGAARVARDGRPPDGAWVPEDRRVREGRSRTTGENLTYSRAGTEQSGPDCRCVIATDNFDAVRAALLARSTGVNGRAVGSHAGAYHWPSATIREFAAVFLTYEAVDLGVCLVIGPGGPAA
ncbi:ElyC/SanA/YdcF family protein [Kitasatospora sp. NPDC056138]|uniref:ElyC/SanA/YdcF family protein n=1 Tax=Kitasatospora sp. NPDC056138 TaxID=3345724 RepID=UPI0035DD480B